MLANGVSGLNATDKTPVYEIPLHFGFRVWDGHFFVLGFWRMAFCPEMANGGNSNACNIKLYNNTVYTECKHTIAQSLFKNPGYR